jgi:hypothetical protein
MKERAFLFLKIGSRGKSEKDTWTEPTQKRCNST